jgi:hypothetical protein
MKSSVCNLFYIKRPLIRKSSTLTFDLIFYFKYYPWLLNFPVHSHEAKKTLCYENIK